MIVWAQIVLSVSFADTKNGSFRKRNSVDGKLKCWALLENPSPCLQGRVGILATNRELGGHQGLKVKLCLYTFLLRLTNKITRKFISVIAYFE